MARSHRRNSLAIKNSFDRSSLPSPCNTPESAEKPDEPNNGDESHVDAEKCPCCSQETSQSSAFSEKENWIRCDVCRTWYHWRCVGNGDDMNSIGKWYCKLCQDANPYRKITFKAPTRKSSRKRMLRDYANLNAGVVSNPNRWPRMLEEKSFKADIFKRMHGSEVNMSWLDGDEDAMREPIVIETTEGLGLEMPLSDITIDEIAEFVGENTPLEVIDVASQTTAHGWTLGKWSEYMKSDPSSRKKILNVISLEISGTKLADRISPPKLVRDLDWVENCWPSSRKGKGHNYPKVQLYCLMGVAKAWTDWHVDFAGSSVYYHVLRGSKIFYFARPTVANLNAYEKWSGTDLQNHIWLGDLVDNVYKVEISQGNTMIIPSGWIHAVYTPVDTLVFGGNFLHSYDVPIQLKVRNIEIATHVPKKFRFPWFSRLCWYVGDKYLLDLKTRPGTHLSDRVVDSLLALADFLISEVRILERGSEQAKRSIKEQIPYDHIKDPSSLARELRWRLKLAANCSSDEESLERKRKIPSSVNGQKRRRIESESLHDNAETAKFKYFKPRNWDAIWDEERSDDGKIVKSRRPADDSSGLQAWLNPDFVDEGDDDAQVQSRRELVVKIRRTANGFERHHIERIIESWTWDNSESKPELE